MRLKLAAVLAAVVGILGLVPMATASAAHTVGGYDYACFTRTGSNAYNGVHVAVVVQGSDVPKNKYIVANGSVTADARCNRPNGIPVLRVQIDRVDLLHGASVLKQVGPVNLGTNHAAATTANQGSVPCKYSLRAYIHFTVRSANGSLGAGGFYGPSFTLC